MEYKIVKNKREWANKLANFDKSMDADWVCDQIRPIERAKLDSKKINAYFDRDKATIAVALSDGELVGYIIGDDDSDGRGGCRGRWVSVQPIEEASVAELLQGLFDVLSDKHGWIWGRITNPNLREAILSFGCVPMDNYQSVFTYRRI